MNTRDLEGYAEERMISYGPSQKSYLMKLKLVH